MRKKAAVMICGHGSRDGGAVAEFTAMVDALKADQLRDYDVESGFLEFARPILSEGMEKLRDRGHKTILALPGMLFAAGHVKNDLPSEVNGFAAAHPDVDVKFGRDLALDPKLLAAHGEEVPRAETCLVVVGRGTNDPDANSNVSKVARMLWEGMGFGWAEVCYSGVAHPRVPAGLTHAARLGYGRVVVFPYFLFTGILIRRIYDAVDAAAAAHPRISFLKAPYLKDHPLVLETFADRLREIEEGTGNMNCQLCKYRERILGYEQDQGTPQAGHHHHVRGIGTDHGHGHHHHHRHDHDREPAA